VLRGGAVWRSAAGVGLKGGGLPETVGRRRAATRRIQIKDDIIRHIAGGHGGSCRVVLSKKAQKRLPMQKEYLCTILFPFFR
jgi:hypothetical protein